jgi:hypothetical protein
MPSWVNTPEDPKTLRIWRENSMESDKYGREWMMTLQGTTKYQPIPKGNQLTRAPCHPSGLNKSRSINSKQKF